MMPIRALILLLLIIQPYAVHTAWADIYSYTDENGGLHFSNIPDDPRYRSVLKTPPNEAAPASFASHIQPIKQQRYAPLVASAAKAYQLEPALLHAVISAESGYNPLAKSPKGAIGLMQLMPATAKRYGISDAYDPAQNIQAGAQYLRDLMRLFNNDLNLTLAAYNAGENAVMRYGNQIPPYTETMLYVPKVLKNYSGLRNNNKPIQ
ncbi:lytic transglycosylase domain-containing protein [Sulfuriferula thiophila]|uniref:lytic transglycosylase domain-containing protein n=1 Tax=Sulfuriferula thiophila TaxID=1781211 RepID=UPI000F60ABA2|nr:lytic transglycosylase domain-containing protein [Sulfuriferula thiophila]